MTPRGDHIFSRNPQLAAGLVRVYEQAVAEGASTTDAMLKVLDRALPLHEDALAKDGPRLRPDVTMEFGLRLGDGTLLTFDTAEERDGKQTEIKRDGWESAPVTRQTRIQHTAWTEEPS
ncbi:hypothetical protein OG384_04375 [Streptomyces sp. NBC_01324]|uniref:hypothetical protein n=1 Tax=Streptomyces sp. NBC_01324 TaxID=2903826 RepID=UPI002E0DD60B|nr:hypothetical protein OG384_04375 [Streptomyces sp. NBC_01324]